MKYIKGLLLKIKSIFVRTQKELETEIKEEIKTEIKETVKEKVLEEVAILIKDMDITPKVKESLIRNGVKTIEDLKEVKDLTDIPGIGPKRAEALKKLIK